MQHARTTGYTAKPSAVAGGRHPRRLAPCARPAHAHKGPQAVAGGLHARSLAPCARPTHAHKGLGYRSASRSRAQGARLQENDDADSKEHC